MPAASENTSSSGLLPASLDLGDWAAQQIVERHRADAPDLSRVLIFVPQFSLVPRLRQRLQHHAGGAILGPTCTTLREFAAARGDSEPPLSPLQARIQLAEALVKFPDLFPGQDPLTLAEELQTLLDQLTRHAPQLAREPQRFTAAIEQAYGKKLAPLTQEATMVQLLWRAYLDQTGVRSPALAEVQALQSAMSRIAGEESVYWLGFDDATPAELHGLRYLLERGACGWSQDATLCAQLGISTTPLLPRSAREQALLNLFATDTEIKPAAHALDGLQTQACAGPEQEARVVELAIRRWLLEGKRDIAVISNDRRFARRLRALLERAHVPLNDEAGWALSTSRAAASLTHWLDCLEQDFHFRPLLDLLKSHFYSDAETLPAVHVLEALIYQGRNQQGLTPLLSLTEAGRGMIPTLHSAAQHWPAISSRLPAHRWSTALVDSLMTLPLWSRWQADTAGGELITLLEHLQLALQDSTLPLHFKDFRRLLDSLLESASFTPQAARGPVRLLTLEQAKLLHCDALVLSGAAAGKFPGTAATPAFFNQGVRTELGLPHWAAQSALALSRFQRLLVAAPAVLITYAPEDEAQDAQPCAWIDYLHAYGLPAATDLAGLSGTAAVEVAEEAPPQSRRTGAQAVAPGILLPTRLSATEHQALINCPYQFFVRNSLRLRAPEAPDDPYSSSDYGQQVHTILHAFYHHYPRLPPPFGEALTPENRDRAATRLRDIARAVFKADLQTRVMAHAWLAQFEAAIPLLLERIAERQDDWPKVLAENQLSRLLPMGVELRGRIDRLERNADGESSVVDYKTGTPPKKVDVESGEDVQAVHYALLEDHCIRTEYWPLSDEPKAKPVVVEGAALEDLRQGVLSRLENILRSLGDGAPLPAHGDAKTCARCEASGICRQQSWSAT